MAKPRKNSTSIDFTPEQKAEARQRLIEGQTTRQIKAAMPAIKNGQQLNGLRREIHHEEAIKAKIRAKDEIAPLPSPIAPKPISIVDRTPVPSTSSQQAMGGGTPITFSSSRIEQSTANMTAPRTGGSIFSWRIYPVNLAGIFGPLPYPYNPDALGRLGGEGTYDVKICHPTGAVQELREVVPASYGPAHNPS